MLEERSGTKGFNATKGISVGHLIYESGNAIELALVQEMKCKAPLHDLNHFLCSECVRWSLDGNKQNNAESIKRRRKKKCMHKCWILLLS